MSLPPVPSPVLGKMFAPMVARFLSSAGRCFGKLIGGAQVFSVPAALDKISLPNEKKKECNFCNAHPGAKGPGLSDKCKKTATKVLPRIATCFPDGVRSVERFTSLLVIFVIPGSVVIYLDSSLVFKNLIVFTININDLQIIFCSSLLPADRSHNKSPANQSLDFKVLLVSRWKEVLEEAC